jgi:putative membrane protein
MFVASNPGRPPLGARASEYSPKPYVHLAVVVSALAVLALGGFVSFLIVLGPLSTHMAMHIAMMNVLAPLCVMGWWIVDPVEPKEVAAGRIWLATAAQMTLLWTWHVPVVQATAMASLLLQFALHGSLFIAALMFWHAVLPSPHVRWQSILALLLTAKLTCLLGALLTFAPRVLYVADAGSLPGHGVHRSPMLPTLDDQQLAGLLMIAACPLSYVLAGIVLAAQILNDLARATNTLGRSDLSAAR